MTWTRTTRRPYTDPSLNHLTRNHLRKTTTLVTVAVLVLALIGTATYAYTQYDTVRGLTSQLTDLHTQNDALKKQYDTLLADDQTLKVNASAPTSMPPPTDTGTTAPSNASTTGPTKWLTYQNKEFGFQFEYPEWGDSPTVTTASPIAGSIGEVDLQYRPHAAMDYLPSIKFVLVKNDEQSSLSQWLSSANGGAVGPLVEHGNFNFGVVTGGGSIAVLGNLPLPTSYSGPPVASAFAMPKDRSYVIIISPDEDDYYPVWLESKDQLLASFAFISRVP